MPLSFFKRLFAGPAEQPPEQKTPAETVHESEQVLADIDSTIERAAHDLETIERQEAALAQDAECVIMECHDTLAHEQPLSAPCIAAVERRCAAVKASIRERRELLENRLLRLEVRRIGLEQERRHAVEMMQDLGQVLPSVKVDGGEDSPAGAAGPMPADCRAALLESEPQSSAAEAAGDPAALPAAELRPAPAGGRGVDAEL
eukprot:TRINITY_DN61516_c0_g1_i1.p1 TRINITY_DN61516_c0_g1~~TRINITY_DN61516_c0_g1_i1.p1  ORF type:complete len:203 (+),score=71.26 TRINITY_DN61516_c0_g1_i1:89-697(+)